MVHKMYVFRLHRTGLVAVTVGALVLGVLLFAGGWLFGVQHGVALAGRLPPSSESLAQAAPVAAAVPPAEPAPRPEPVRVPAAPDVRSEQAAPPSEAAPVEESGAETEPVAPSPEPAPARAAPSLVASAYSLQVAAFVVEDNAKAAVADLVERGFEPRVVKERGSLDRLLYRVVLGQYGTRAEASAAARAFRRDEHRDAIVVETRVAPTSSG